MLWGLLIILSETLKDVKGMVFLILQTVEEVGKVLWGGGSR